jgi:peptidoglycan hydrolase CwlO-like protein
MNEETKTQKSTNIYKVVGISFLLALFSAMLMLMAFGSKNEVESKLLDVYDLKAKTETKLSQSIKKEKDIQGEINELIVSLQDQQQESNDLRIEREKLDLETDRIINEPISHNADNSVDEGL